MISMTFICVIYTEMPDQSIVFYPIEGSETTLILKMLYLEADYSIAVWPTRFDKSVDFIELSRSIFMTKAKSMQRSEREAIKSATRNKRGDYYKLVHMYDSLMREWRQFRRMLANDSENTLTKIKNLNTRIKTCRKQKEDAETAWLIAKRIAIPKMSNIPVQFESNVITLTSNKYFDKDDIINILTKAASGDRESSDYKSNFIAMYASYKTYMKRLKEEDWVLMMKEIRMDYSTKMTAMNTIALVF